MPEPEPVPDSPPSPGRWGLRGDFTWRFLTGAVEATPWYFEGITNALWTGIIGLFAIGPVRNLAGNLRALGVRFPRWRAWLTIRRFGEVSIDSLRSRSGNVLQWEVEGLEHVRAAEASGHPVVLWTAHMGSYDTAAAVFGGQLKGRLHSVRKPEANPRLQSIRAAGLNEIAGGRLTVHYNRGGEEGLALELMRVLKRGEWVALQADRALEGLSTFRIVADGLEWTLPKGPFVLPLAARAACLPVFINRIGPRRYRVRFHPLIPRATGRDHATISEELARTWTRLLGATIKEFPDQWFAFESLIRPAPKHAD